VLKGFLLLLVLGTASASTIATVNCDGNIVSDPTFAQCNDGKTHAYAQVFSPWDVGGSAWGAPIGSSGFSSTSVSLSGTYLFTVTGGTGGGFFLPCVSAYIFPPFASADASFFGNGVGYSVSGTFMGANTCISEGLASASPFMYGVGQQFEISLSASAFGPGQGQWDAEASLGSFRTPEFEFWDSNGTPPLER